MTTALSAKERMVRVVELCQSLIRLDLTDQNYRQFIQLKRDFELEIAQLGDESACLDPVWLACQFRVIAIACCKIYLYCWSPQVIIFMGTQLSGPDKNDSSGLTKLVSVLRSAITSPECRGWFVLVEKQGVALVGSINWAARKESLPNCYVSHLTGEGELWELFLEKSKHRAIN